MSEGTATLNIRIDFDPFLRAMHDASESMRGIGFAFGTRRQPRPPRRPYRKTWSGMTAREYRAARRAYARALRAHRKATR